MMLVQAYNWPLPEIITVGLIKVTSACSPMPLEVHPDSFELLYLQTGEKPIMIDDRRYEMRGGDILIIPPGVHHGNTNEVQNRSSIVYIIFHDPADDEGFLGLDERTRVQLSEKLMNVRCAHMPQYAKTLLEKFVEHVRESNEPMGFYEEPVYRDEGDALNLERIRSLLFLLLDEITRSAHEANVDMGDDIRRVIEYIGEHTTEMPDITALSEIAGLSEAHFKQKFKHVIGMPPAEYIARTHISMAEELLLKTDMSMVEIAASLGFASGQHFARIFKRYKGQTPSDFRDGIAAETEPDEIIIERKK